MVEVENPNGVLTEEDVPEDEGFKLGYDPSEDGIRTKAKKNHRTKWGPYDDAEKAVNTALGITATMINDPRYDGVEGDIGEVASDVEIDKEKGKITVYGIPTETEEGWTAFGEPHDTCATALRIELEKEDYNSREMVETPGAVRY